MVKNVKVDSGFHIAFIRSILSALGQQSMRMRLRGWIYRVTCILSTHVQSIVTNLQVFKVRLSNMACDLLARLRQIAYTKVINT